MRKAAIALLVTLAMVLGPLSGPLAAELPPGPGAGSEDGGSRAVPMATVTRDFSVRNPSAFARGPEVAWVELSAPAGVLLDADDITLYDRSSMREVLCGHLDDQVTRHPDGSVHRVTVHFRDSWIASGTNDYRAVLGQTPTTTGSPMTDQVSGEFLIVQDSAHEWQLHMDDSVFGQYTSVYYIYIVNSPSRQVRAHGSVLTRVGGNQLDPDQMSFQMYWGRHSSLRVQRSPLLTRVTLGYSDPEIIHWGPAGSSVQEIVREVDFISAEVELTFYKGLPRVDVHSEKVVNERFWNHNGFVMEFSAIVGEGADWQGEYETVFGTDPRHVLKTTTEGPTWTRVTGTWQDVDVGSDAAPAIGDLNGDGLLDMVVGDGEGNLRVYENVGSAAEADLVNNTTWATGLPTLDHAKPALGDLDADGDLDLILGESKGYLKVYRNEGGQGGPPSWTRWWGNFDRLGLSPHTAPTFCDADGDGDLDVLVGLDDGTFQGIENVGTRTSPSWSLDNRWVQHLNQGATRSPGENYAVPHVADFDSDGDGDLLIGSDDGKVTYFENTGDRRNPDWDRLDVALFAGIWGRSWVDANSTPVMADVDGDGDLDLVMGTQDGVLEFYRLDGFTTPYKGHNNLQPLLNGSYRLMRDKDGNDGPFVVEGYGGSFDGFYVLANPRNGYAAMRYIPDFDRLAYRQEYYGDAFPWAGGNVSYYPYDTVAREYVTRAQITSNAMSNGVSAGTFISQTGTSAGFVMQPMTAMVYESDEVLLLDMVRQADPADYDTYVETLEEPLVPVQPVDLFIADLATDPDEPGSGEPTQVHVSVRNAGDDVVEDVRVLVQAFGADEAELTRLSLGPEDVGARETVTLTADLDTFGWLGEVTLRATVDPDDEVNETEEGDNSLEVTKHAEPLSLPWSEPLAATRGANCSLHADMLVRRDGKLQVVWETLQGHEDIDIEGRVLDPSTDTWDPIELLVSDSHYAVEPDLAQRGDTLFLAYSSNGVALDKYLKTRHARYYWGEKFDIHVMEWDDGSWGDPVRVTQAVEYDDSDQAPDVVYGAGAVRIFFRNTHFQFYTNGNQMDNVPYQELDVRTATLTDGVGWDTGNQTVGGTAGSQAWWGGPKAAPEGSDLVWVVQSSEVGNSQWDLFAEAIEENGDTTTVRLTSTSGRNEVRPAIGSSNHDPAVMVAYETTKNGNRDIAVRWRSPGGDPNSGWSSERLVTTHPADDMKPTVVCTCDGDWYVAWESWRTGNKDIFISRFDGTEWHGPYQVTSHPGSDEQPVLAKDDQDGRLFIGWETDRNGMGNKDVYVRHMLPGGPSLTLQDPGTGHEDTALEVTGDVVDPNDDLQSVSWDWGDGNASETGGVKGAHAYEAAGTYTITATARDRFGLVSDAASIQVTVENVPPVANLTGEVEAVEDVKVPLSAWLSRDTPSDNESLLVTWDYGDDTTEGPLVLWEAANRTHSYGVAGIYNVTVNVTDDDGDWDLARLTVTVVNLPPSVTAWEDAWLEEDEEGTFHGSATDTPSDTQAGLSFVWEWGDGTSTDRLTDPTSTHAYASSGNFTATLHCYDVDGTEGTATLNVTVANVEPEVTVTGPSMATEDEAITLTAEGDDTPSDLANLEYLWTWGDGSPANWTRNGTATHSWKDSGVYEVTVRVRDDDGEVATFMYVVSVNNKRPSAVATATPSPVPEGDTVHITANGSTDTPSDLPYLTYIWEIGGELYYDFELDHVFTASGLHTITLTVKDDDGDTATGTVDVLVVNRPPTSDGWVGPLELYVGEVLSLDGTNSTDDTWDVDGLKYKWLMGDGTSYSTAEALHLYTLQGEYIVVLEVSDSDGDKDTWTTTVTVLAEEEDDGGEKELPVAAIAGVAVAVLVVLVVLLLFMRRGGAAPAPAGEAGPPEEGVPEGEDAEEGVPAEDEEEPGGEGEEMGTAEDEEEPGGEGEEMGTDEEEEPGADEGDADEGGPSPEEGEGPEVDEEEPERD